MIGKPQLLELLTPSGERYTVEVEAFWDTPTRHDNIRILVLVSGVTFWSATCPSSNSFILSPDGRFVGE